MRAYVIILLCLLFTIACGPKKGYEGPELPPEQISQIRFQSVDNVKVSKRIVDDTTAPVRGIDVLPDVHKFQLVGKVVGPPRRCNVRTTFNASGYRNCLEKNSYCDCFDYLSVYKDCAFPVWPSTCVGAISTLPGKVYDIKMYLEQDRVYVATTVRESSGQPAFGKCKAGKQQWESSSNYEGTGRSTAYQNGVTGCGY